MLADAAAVTRLLESLPDPPALRTRLTPEYLRWRYGTSAAVATARSRPRAARRTASRSSGSGAAATAREAALCDVIAAGGDPARSTATLTRAVTRAVDADYVIRLGGGIVAPGGLVRLPGQGPLLTWRAVSDAPAPPDAWDLSLGDIELF